MENDAQNLLTTVVSKLVEFPADIQIECALDEKGVLMTIRAHDDDVGRIIGRTGVTIQAIRSIMHAYGMKNRMKISVKIDDPKHR